MLVTFYCEAYPNITMFGDVAHRLLSLMGQSGSVPGAILSDDVLDALQHLKQGLKGKATAVAHSSKLDEDEEEEISLDKRAIPLIELLEAAIKEGCDVMWK